MSNNKLAYFSMADPSIKGLANKNDFNKSLISNLLFQEQILITDVYFFSSPNIKKHVLENKKGKSIIEAGVEHGFVIPAFRDKQKPTFTETLSRIKKTNIKGVLDDVDRVAGYLQKAADANKKFSPTFWPDYSVGVEFAKLTNKYFGRKNPLPVGANSNISIHTAWKLSEKWRTDLIQKAIESSPNPNQDGLRRGELYSLIAKELGSKNLKDIQPSDLIKLTSPRSKERELVKIFCTWINTLYQYNQAIHFSASTNFPGYDSTITALSTELIGRDIPDPIDYHTEEMGFTIERKIYLPSIRAVNEIATDRILEIRNYSGGRYFYDLEVWQKKPTDANKQAVIGSLDIYNKELKNLFQSSSEAEHPINVILKSQTQPTRMLVKLALETIASATAVKMGLDYLPTLILFSEFGFALYNWISHIDNYKLTMKAEGQARPAEINAPK